MAKGASDMAGLAYRVVVSPRSPPATAGRRESPRRGLRLPKGLSLGEGVTPLPLLFLPRHFPIALAARHGGQARVPLPGTFAQGWVTYQLPTPPPTPRFFCKCSF